MASSSSSVVGSRVGNYEIVRRIGKGGMGEVYVARHPMLGREVAVKVLNDSLSDDEESLERFRREALAANRIGHEAIVEVTDFGELGDGRQYYIMELLRGDSLKVYLASHAHMSVEEVAEILEPLCDALAAAHAKGIIHRDIKPDNLFLTQSDDGKQTLKVLDFGIAKLIDPGAVSEASMATRTGQLLGTPHYMSPEQAAGVSESIGPWTDVYSLGAVLFHMLAGRPPFEGRSFGALLLMHMEEPPPTLTDSRPDVPLTISQVIKKAMAKEPSERYLNVHDLYEDYRTAAGLGDEHELAAERTIPGAEALAAADAALATGRTAFDPSHLATAETELGDSDASGDPTLPSDQRGPPTGRAKRRLDRFRPPTQAELARGSGSALDTNETDSLPAGSHLGDSTMARRRKKKGLPMGYLGLGAAIVAAVVVAVVVLSGGDKNQRPRPPTPTPRAGAMTPTGTGGPDAAAAAGMKPTPAPTLPEVKTNPWVEIARPPQPVLLGLANPQSDDPSLAHRANVRCCDFSFVIQTHEVTWDEYLAWAKKDPARRFKAPFPKHASGRYPVTGIPWRLAGAYCRSLQGSLPMEKEWEYAARGPRLRPNPWGSVVADPLNTALLVGNKPELREVCTSPQDVIRHGGDRLCDMAGNAMEWTRGAYVFPLDPNNPPKGYRYAGANARLWRTVRGLPWLANLDRVPVAASTYRSPGYLGRDPKQAKDGESPRLIGFRCVRKPKM